MRSKEDLFRLIKSLSKTEKRYFTLDAQKSGMRNRNYLQLFKAVNDMEFYDESILRKKFPKLSADKAYLYEAILRSMRDYRSANSKSAQIKERILDSKFLYERGLYDQCEERLQNAKELATQLSDTLSLLEINLQERRFVREVKKNKFLLDLQGLIDETESLQQDLSNEKDLTNLYDKLLKKSVIRESEKENTEETDEVELTELLFNPTIRTESINRRQLLAQALYFQQNSDYDSVLKRFEKVVEWWEKHPAIKSEEYYTYLTDLTNLAHSFIFNQKQEQLKVVLEKLGKEQPNNYNERRIYFHRVSTFKLLYYMNFGNYDEALALLSEIINGLKEYPSQKDIILKGNISVVYFITKNYPECAAWTTEIIKDKKNKNRPAVLEFMWLLHLFSSYEILDVEQFENKFRGARRALKALGMKKDSFVSKLLNQLRSIFESTGSEKNMELKSFKAFLMQNREKPPQFAIEELLIWVNSKI